MPRKQQNNVNEIDIVIGKRLENLRNKLGISRNKLAIDSELNYRTIDNCEKGYNSLSISTLRKMYDNFFKYEGYTFTTLFDEIVSKSYLSQNDS